MPHHRRAIAGTVLALSAAATAAAYAQPPPGAEAQPRLERGERLERREQRTVIIRHGDETGVDRAEHLRAILQLKPAQEAALTAYLAAVRPNHDPERMMRLHDESPPKSTPERLARMETRMAEHEAAMKTQIAGTRRFYDQLDPAQKRAFDELPLMMGGPPMPMISAIKILHHPAPPLPPLPPVPPRS